MPARECITGDVCLHRRRLRPFGGSRVLSRFLAGVRPLLEPRAVAAARFENLFLTAAIGGGRDVDAGDGIYDRGAVQTEVNGRRRGRIAVLYGQGDRRRRV